MSVGNRRRERAHLSESEVMKLPRDPQFLHELFPVSLFESLRLQLCHQHIHLQTDTAHLPTEHIHLQTHTPYPLSSCTGDLVLPYLCILCILLTPLT